MGARGRPRPRLFLSTSAQLTHTRTRARKRQRTGTHNALQGERRMARAAQPATPHLIGIW